MKKFAKACRFTCGLFGGSSWAISIGCPVVGVVLFGLAVVVTCVIAAE
jgi:hypothetical protein